MKCTICKKLMKIVKEDKSFGFKKKKEYSRTTYNCLKDDLWIVVEIPER